MYLCNSKKTLKIFIVRELKLLLSKKVSVLKIGNSKSPHKKGKMKARMGPASSYKFNLCHDYAASSSGVISFC